ncbi:MAG: shikimate kinase [Actinobacteria bacterium]|nr:shikimate kinase [Actinomycetota bacterium]
MTRPRAVIVGVPGAGKTSVGKSLARSWQVDFRDTDADVEVLAGKSVSDIFVDDGEPRFRELEKDAVAHALTEHEGVLALGGGAILDDSTRALLADHVVVWLNVGLADATKRVGLSSARPLLLGNVRSTMLRLMQEREPFYREVATVEIETDGRAIADIVAEVKSELARSAHA